MKYEKMIEEFKCYLLEEERSENTIDSYINAVKLYFNINDNLSKENMVKFKSWLMQKYAAKTVHSRLCAMNAFCDFVDEPKCKVKNIKIQKQSSVENVITLDEYNQMLNWLVDNGNIRGYYMIRFLAQTGARVSEFIRLPRKALDDGYAELWTKGKVRRIYIPQSLIEESRDFFEGSPQSELLFVNRYGKNLTTRGVAQLIINWGTKAGIRREVLHPHSFRHLYAIQFLKHNKDISLLADLMGHSSIETTSIYTKLSKEEQLRQFNIASKWG